MPYTVTLIPGDGIGPEVTQSVKEILHAADVPVLWEEVEAGASEFDKHGETIPDDVIASIKKNHVALKGPLTTPVARGFQSANVKLRKTLDLYACLRPVVNLPGVPAPFSNIDLVVIRENTEDLYSGIEHEIADGVVTSLKIITEHACRRIVKFAFDYCRMKGRKKVTVAHKASVLPLSDGLFLHAAREVADSYPFVDYDEIPLDMLSLELVNHPEWFDVLVLENLYGDIISDLCSGLVGGLGVVPGANIGDSHAVFEAVHGSAPDIAGKNCANPLALLLSALMMLEYIGEPRAALRIQRALNEVLTDGTAKTKDIGGNCTTTEFTKILIEKIKTLHET